MMTTSASTAASWGPRQSSNLQSATVFGESSTLWSGSPLGAGHGHVHAALQVRPR